MIKEKSRIVTRIIALVMAMIIFVSMFTVAGAASTYINIVSRKAGTIEGSEKITKKFTLPVKSKVRLLFHGYEDDGNTYGAYKITIRDSDGELVYSKTDATGYDDAKYVKELPKGKYVLRISAVEDYSYYPDSLEYNYSLQYKPSGEYNAKKVTLNKSSLSLKRGATKTLAAKVTPSYATSGVTWTTSNKNVAVVGKTGKVKAKALGIAKIVATSGKKKATCKVVVNSADATLIRKKSGSLLGYVKYISGYQNATWASSNSAIASVNSAGTVTAKSNGECKIYCKIKGVVYTINTVVVNAVSIAPAYIDDTSIYNEAGIKFKNNTNKTITYMTLNIKQYDNRGYRLSSPYDYYYVNDTLAAKSTATWEFWVNDNTKTVSAYITKVWFSDGTTWTP